MRHVYNGIDPKVKQQTACHKCQPDHNKHAVWLQLCKRARYTCRQQTHQNTTAIERQNGQHIKCEQNQVKPNPHSGHQNKEICAGLSQADPAGADYYQKRGQAYSAQIVQLSASIQKEINSIPPEQRKVVTSHDAFNYFARAFGITFLAPQGVSTESESSAKAIAQLSEQIKSEHIKALFFENISNPKMMAQLTQETGVKIGGKLYSDALSNADEPAPSYLKMMAYNAKTLVDGMR